MDAERIRVLSSLAQSLMRAIGHLPPENRTAAFDRVLDVLATSFGLYGREACRLVMGDGAESVQDQAGVKEDKVADRVRYPVKQKLLLDAIVSARQSNSMVEVTMDTVGNGRMLVTSYQGRYERRIFYGQLESTGSWSQRAVGLHEAS